MDRGTRDPGGGSFRLTDQGGGRRRLTSRILPPYMRRSPKVAEVLPVLDLRGLSTDGRSLGASASLLREAGVTASIAGAMEHASAAAILAREPVA